MRPTGGVLLHTGRLVGGRGPGVRGACAAQRERLALVEVGLARRLAAMRHALHVRSGFGELPELTQAAPSLAVIGASVGLWGYAIGVSGTGRIERIAMAHSHSAETALRLDHLICTHVPMLRQGSGPKRGPRRATEDRPLRLTTHNPERTFGIARRVRQDPV